MTEFPWPCELRIAHGSHAGCGGVKAHPATMIGRVVVSTEVPEPRRSEWRWPREISQTLPAQYRKGATVGTIVTLTNSFDSECKYEIVALKSNNIAKLVRVG